RAPADAIQPDDVVDLAFQLRVPLPDVVAMQTRQPNLERAGEIPLRRLVKEALRMRPSRIVVGEVCQEECLDLTRLTGRTVRAPPDSRGRSCCRQRSG
ncbi:ATPase, T2SS/T4P/T4SS family, partial [Geodermatophilus maliterrae]